MNIECKYGHSIEEYQYDYCPNCEVEGNYQ